MTQKCKAIALLNNARDNAIISFNSTDSSRISEIIDKEITEIEDAIENPVSFAMDILRHEMKDKTEGELYHAWMCNIKWAVADAIKNQSPIYKDFDSFIQNGCEEGAKVFLDRLLKQSEKEE